MDAGRRILVYKIKNVADLIQPSGKKIQNSITTETAEKQ